jgi:hypothetical protein
MSDEAYSLELALESLSAIGAKVRLWIASPDRKTVCGSTLV